MGFPQPAKDMGPGIIPTRTTQWHAQPPEGSSEHQPSHSNKRANTQSHQLVFTYKMVQDIINASAGPQQ